MDTSLIQPGDLRALVIGALGSIVAYLLMFAVTRYWSYHSVKSIQRRIKYAEERRVILDSLVTSDRAVMIFCFQILFIILFLSVSFFMLIFMSSIPNSDIQIIHLAFVLMWAVISFLSIYPLHVLSQVHIHPKSVEAIDKKIATLKTRHSKLTGNE